MLLSPFPRKTGQNRIAKILLSFLPYFESILTLRYGMAIAHSVEILFQGVEGCMGKAIHRVKVEMEP